MMPSVSQRGPGMGSRAGAGCLKCGVAWRRPILGVGQFTSKKIALLLADLSVIKSHSRPYVGDDNPYSKAQFKTLKYRPGFP